MAPRANWKGYLRLSLVSCPVALYPATSSTSRVAMNTLNRKTGHKVRRLLVEPDTGEEVPSEDQVKGYPVAKNTFIQIEDEEIEAIKLETSQTIEIQKFVPRYEIDTRYMDSPYYIAPDGRVGLDAFSVIRDSMRETGVVAIGRVVMARRERIMMVEPWDKGLLATLLRYNYEVRAATAYFEDIEDAEVTEEARHLAELIIKKKSGHFDPTEFEDRYEKALLALIKSKEAGTPLPSFVVDEPSRNVINLMEALKKSIAQEGKPALEIEKKPAATTRKAPAKRKTKSA